MPRGKAKKTTEEKDAATTKEAVGAPIAETETEEKPGAEHNMVIDIPAVVTRVLSVTISGEILVAKPVPHDVAVVLSPYSPTPPRAGGKWTEKEKKENQKRERAKWKLGKKGHYKVSLDALKMSSGPGYGIPSAAIMRAIQTVNKQLPGHRIPPELLNMAIKIPPHDHEKGLLRVVAKRGPFMKEDVVRVGHKEENNWKGTPSLTVRPAWINWKIKLDVLFTQNLLDGEQVFNLLMWAGQAGIMEGRPSKGSALNWGMVTVHTSKDRLKKIG